MTDIANTQSAKDIKRQMRRRMLADFWFYFSENRGAVIGLWVFIALAVVSLLTMLLSLLHGPMLAMMGLVGAYVVPILVSTGSGNIFAAMVYSLIITGAGLLLVRYVSKSWLWWSVVAGAMGWWLVSLASNQHEEFRGLYLAIFAWALLAIPSFDWLLQAKGRHMTLWPDKKVIDTAIGYVSMNQLVLMLIVLHL